MLGEHLVVFWPSLDRSGFLPIGPELKGVASAVIDKFSVKLAALAWLSGHDPKAFMTARWGGDDPFGAKVVDLFSRFLQAHSITCLAR